MSKNHMNDAPGWDDQPLPNELQALFASYREAIPDPDASVNFMPSLWTAIESKQVVAYSFRRLARTIVTGAAALSLAMSLMFIAPSAHRLTMTSTYVDVLADDHVDDGTEPELAHVEAL
jgi:hypothetical protein